MAVSCGRFYPTPRSVTVGAGGGVCEGLFVKLSVDKEEDGDGLTREQPFVCTDLSKGAIAPVRTSSALFRTDGVVLTRAEGFING